MTTPKVCLVSIAIGEKYIEEYERLFKPSQKAYALKHGYDFKVIKDYLCPVEHHSLITMNKILVCNPKWANKYDYVVFIDADIIINQNAPPIHTAYDFGDKIGCVTESQPTLEARHALQRHKGFEITAKEYYRDKANLNIETDHVINTGVLILQPVKHKEFMQSIYDKYWAKQIDNPNGYHYEQSVIGYEIQSNNMHQFMDWKWNAVWALSKSYADEISKQPLTLQQFFDDNYFIHLAGHADYDKVPFLKQN